MNVPDDAILDIKKKIVAAKRSSIDSLISDDLQIDLLEEARTTDLDMKSFIESLDMFDTVSKAIFWSLYHYNALSFSERNDLNRYIMSLDIVATIDEFMKLFDMDIDVYIDVNKYTITKMLTGYNDMNKIDSRISYTPLMKGTSYKVSLNIDVDLKYLFEMLKVNTNVPLVYLNDVFKFHQVHDRKRLKDHIATSYMFHESDQISGLTNDLVEFVINSNMKLSFKVDNKNLIYKSDIILKQICDSISTSTYEVMNTEKRSSYTVVIPNEQINYEIMGDMIMNDMRFSVFFHHRNITSKSKSRGDLRIAFHDVITNNRATLRFGNKKEGLRISLSHIIDTDHLDVVLGKIAAALELYKQNYSVYERSYKLYDPNISVKYEPTESKHDYVKDFFGAKYTKKAAKKPAIFDSLESLYASVKPKTDLYMRFATLNIKDKETGITHKSIAYCDDINRPYPRFMIDDLNSSDDRTHIVVCRKTPINEGSLTISRSKGRANLILKEYKLAKEDQLGQLHDDMKVLFKLVSKDMIFYRLGTTTTVTDYNDPIAVGSYFDKQLGVTEPHNGLYINYKWAFLSTILFALDIEGYKLNIEDREQIVDDQINVIYNVLHDKSYFIEEDDTDDYLDHMKFFSPNTFIRLLEYIYNIQIIVIERLDDDTERFMPVDDYTVLSSELKTRDTCIVYMHTGGTWGRLTCELVLAHKDEEELTIFNGPVVHDIIELYAKTQPVAYVEIPAYILKNVRAQVLDSHMNVRCLILDDAYCITDPLYILDVPVVKSIPTYANKKLTMRHFSDNTHAWIIHNHIKYTFPLVTRHTNKYQKHIDMKKYAQLLKQYCFYMFAMIYDNENDIQQFVNEYIELGEPTSREYTYKINEDAFPIIMNQRQIDWIKQQLLLDMKSVSSYIQQYKVSQTTNVLDYPYDISDKIYNIDSKLLDIPYIAYDYIIFRSIQKLVYMNMNFICYLVPNRYEASGDQTKLNVLVIDCNDGKIKSHLVTPHTSTNDTYIGVYKRLTTLRYIRMIRLNL